MVDVFTKSKRSEVMSRIRSHGNRETELAMVKLFRAHQISGWRRGVSIRLVDALWERTVHIRPDFVFRKIYVAVFIDGEFWHGHPTRARIPKTRRVWWKRKIEANKARDRMQNRLLRKHGWRVIRIWAYEMKTPAALRKLKPLLG
ncbi:MAG TPA: very short patch repair endonuclease [Kiritimatiellia bacterium]|nr:very short patch repair endonuclease [Kiritimatiellia bacterium]HMO99745.1 very short patch repair endonuclease [Kiritimatiellia bacterium]HMP00016.1 very short patch repair endonuclease [Kiritimatiellia bacterium]HMP97314.1 very short patch repair endonuclease [Kiritimatiellia bacterium]